MFGQIVGAVNDLVSKQPWLLFCLLQKTVRKGEGGN